MINPHSRHFPPPPHDDDDDDDDDQHNDRGRVWAINTWNRLDCILSSSNEPAYDLPTTFTINALAIMMMMMMNMIIVMIIMMMTMIKIINMLKFVKIGKPIKPSEPNGIGSWPYYGNAKISEAPVIHQPP